MFLFLSKLLPLFFYPLGLSCLLLLIALVMIWRRRSRLAMIPITVAFLILLLSSNGEVSGALVRSLEWQNLPPREIPPAEAIVVLGGCTRSADYPRPWVEVAEAGNRILYAAKLYREGKAPKVILSGGRIDWLGKGPSESADMAQLITTMGVPTTAIWQDPTSLNTRENAVNVQQIMATQGIHKILLVTSAIHMPRSLLIFQKLGINAIAAPTDFLMAQVNSAPTSEQFILTGFPDTDPLRNTTRVIKEYVGILVYKLRGWA